MTRAIPSFLPPARRGSLALTVALLALTAGGATASRAEGTRYAPTPMGAAELLAPLDTSSPRGTMRGFIDTMDHIYSAVTQRHTHPPGRARLQHLFSQMMSCLDLSAVAPSLVITEARDAAVCLKEVLDRVPVPADSEIPDADAVRDQNITRWRVPGTEIVLVRLATGDRAGEFVFATDSVSRAKEFFQRVNALPYKPTAGSPGLHQAYVTLGGWMIPDQLLHSLPLWARTSIGGETVWQWVATLLLVLLAAAAVRGALRVAQRAVHTPGTLSLGSFIFPATLIASSLTVDYLLTFQVRLTGERVLLAKLCLESVTLTGVVIGILAASRRITDWFLETRGKRGDAIDGQMIRLVSRVGTVAVTAWIVFHAVDRMGISVTPLVAGLGVGGLAVALAAQHTTENLIAGIVLFTDKPVRIGEECQFGSVRGTVEEIGLRSTRIRSADRTLITIPNAEFAKLQLINFTRRDHILFKAVLALASDTSTTQMRTVLVRLRKLLMAHPQVERNSSQARFVAHGPASLDIECSAFTHTNCSATFLSIQEELLLSMMEVVRDSGCEFAAQNQPAQVSWTERPRKGLRRVAAA